VPRFGICENGRCPLAARAERVEVYAGAGEFCPECGERLKPVAAEPAAASPAWLRRNSVVAVVAAVAVCIVIAAAATRVFGGTSVRVCTTSMTQQLAGDMVHSYAARPSFAPPHFAVGPSKGEPCDVRFWTARGGAQSAVLAHDAVVIVVNPGNPISRLSADQVRAIYSGQVTDWSQVGGPRGAIDVYFPADGSDAIEILNASIFRAMRVTAGAHRLATEGEIVRSVAAAAGARAIGVAAFSASVPAKVIALTNADVPSSLSIAGHRYPLATRIMLESDFRVPTPAAADLIAFARSAAGTAVVARTGFVGKDGF
jgi:hypothetical protein